MEVPTIISYSSLQRTTEQHVDIPVPGLGGRYPGLQGLLSGQSSTASQVALERLSERIAEQIVDFPVSRGGLPVFRPGQGSSSSSHDPARVSEALDEPGEWVFRTFPQIQKSATQPPHSGSALPPHSSPWTPAACDASMVLEEEEESEDEPVEFVEYVQHDGLWCGCEWDPTHQRYCWCLAAADGSQAGRT